MWTKRTTFVSALILILSLTAAFAQSRSTRTLGTPRDNNSNSNSNNNLITLDFPEGTLGDYVQGLMEVMRSKTTIIIDSELEEIQVPSAHLREVTLQQALEWIPKTANARQQGLVLQAIS